jgi:hypothetical protein
VKHPQSRSNLHFNDCRKQILQLAYLITYV